MRELYSKYDTLAVNFIYTGKPIPIPMGYIEPIVSPGAHQYVSTIDPLIICAQNIDSSQKNILILDFLKSTKQPYTFLALSKQNDLKSVPFYVGPTTDNPFEIREYIQERIYNFQQSKANLFSNAEKFLAHDKNTNSYKQYIHEQVRRQERFKKTTNIILNFNSPQLVSPVQQFMYAQLSHLNHKENKEFDFFEQEIKGMTGNIEYFNNALYYLKLHHKRLEESIEHFSKLYEGKYSAVITEDKSLEKVYSKGIEDFISGLRSYL